MTKAHRRAITAGMDDRTLITQIGLALWGTAWVDPMANALKQQKGIISDWARGRLPVPAGVWKELREIVRLHGLKLGDLDPQIVQAYDAANQLAMKSRT